MAGVSVSEWSQTQLGRVLAQRWTLLRCIGIGGSAAVFEAQHRNGKRVAIKVLRPEHLADAVRCRRFLREGYAANNVEHPRVVSIDDDHREADGTLFLVMELLEGESLDCAAARAGGRLPWPLVASCMLELLEVLDAAHARGIVHRDLKPANLFLHAETGLRVLDFGLAHLDGAEQSTHEGALLGTPSFMAPEQARALSQTVGPLADVWAVGAIAFSLLTGRHVHQAPNVQEQLARAGAASAPRLSSLQTDVPERVCQVFQRALEYDQQDRYPTARAMHDALRAVLRNPGADYAPQVVQGSNDLSTLDEAPPVGTTQAPRKRAEFGRLGTWPRWVFAALVVGGVLSAWHLTDTSEEAVRRAPAAPVEAEHAEAEHAEAEPAEAVRVEEQHPEALADAAQRGQELRSRPAAAPSARTKAAPSSTPTVRAGGLQMIAEPPF